MGERRPVDERGSAQRTVTRRHRVRQRREVAGGGLEFGHEGGAVVARRHRHVRHDLAGAPPLAERGVVPCFVCGALEQVGQRAELLGDQGHHCCLVGVHDNLLVRSVSGAAPGGDQRGEILGEPVER